MHHNNETPSDLEQVSSAKSPPPPLASENQQQQSPTKRLDQLPKVRQELKYELWESLNLSMLFFSC